MGRGNGNTKKKGKSSNKKEDREQEKREKLMVQDAQRQSDEFMKGEQYDSSLIGDPDDLESGV